jgi:hypothetical protein
MSTEQNNNNANLCATVEGNNPTWRSKRGNILLKDMDNGHLQKAKLYAQTQELHYHNKMCIFSKLITDLESEAEKRGITLKDLDEVKPMGDFFRNKRTLSGKAQKLNKE